MKKRERIPEERFETIRQEILRLLEAGPMGVGDLSREISKPEKELYDHLEHLLGHSSLEIIPAECRKCGYVFDGRVKVKKPGKCPRCKGTHIAPPVFKVSVGGGGHA